MPRKTLFITFAAVLLDASFIPRLTSRKLRGFSEVPHVASPNVMRYGGNASSKMRAACRSAVAKPSVNRS
jgi:hypothetical protein